MPAIAYSGLLCLGDGEPESENHGQDGRRDEAHKGIPGEGKSAGWNVGQDTRDAATKLEANRLRKLPGGAGACCDTTR